EAQHAVRSSLFYLLGSVREGARWSIPPMGLSGAQWGGHVFWDADTWMFPVLGLLHPELARSIVDYRSHTLEGAKWNARKEGYRGADYATESAVTGREIAPAEFPFHDQTSADVGIAQWRHFLLNGDKERLERVAYPILREAAIYYQSRSVYNKAEDRYEIRQVISPDETAGFVDNDVYTNAAAKLCLQYAVEASRLLEKPYPSEWTAISDKLWLPFDKENRRYLEHEGYKKTRRMPKQADAQLLFFPLDLPAPFEVKANTLTFYAGHTSPIGPAMTSSVHAVIAAQLAAQSSVRTDAKPAIPGDEQASTGKEGRGEEGTGETGPGAGSKSEGEWRKQALEYFRQSYRPFVRPPFYNFSEKRSMNNTTFLTGCAGVGMGPLYGFGGIHYDSEGIRATPVLPEPWKRLKITGIHYRGSVYDLEVTPGTPGRLQKREARP
ncbi:MAG: hypothetical protein KY468_21420, partial [Armatimonadetes bacterium]|nr:hypothetical protein [Armatimonadota bacterium]